jgi:hypothetical protein
MMLALKIVIGILLASCVLCVVAFIAAAFAASKNEREF